MARYNVGEYGHIISSPYRRVEPMNEVELEDAPEGDLPSSRWLPSVNWIPLDAAAEKASGVAYEVTEWKKKLQQHSGKQIGDPAGDVVMRSWKQVPIMEEVIVKDKDGTETVVKKDSGKKQRVQIEEAVPFPDDEIIAQEFWDKPTSKKAKQHISSKKAWLEQTLGASALEAPLEARIREMVAREMRTKLAPEPVAMSEVEGARQNLRKKARAADQDPA